MLEEYCFGMLKPMTIAATAAMPQLMKMRLRFAFSVRSSVIKSNSYIFIYQSESGLGLAPCSVAWVSTDYFTSVATTVAKVAVTDPRLSISAKERPRFGRLAGTRISHPG